MGQSRRRSPARHVRAWRSGTRALRRCCSRAIDSASSRCISIARREASCSRPRCGRCSRRGWFRARSIASRLTSILTYQTVASPRTLVAGVQMMAPGHGRDRVGGSGFTSVSTGTCSARPMRRPPTRPPEAMRARLAAVLDEAAALHMVSDVPVGVFLSGGVDSSAVGSLVRRSRRRPPHLLRQLSRHRVRRGPARARDRRGHSAASTRRFLRPSEELARQLPDAVAARRPSERRRHQHLRRVARGSRGGHQGCAVGTRRRRALRRVSVVSGGCVGFKATRGPGAGRRRRCGGRRRPRCAPSADRRSAPPRRPRCSKPTAVSPRRIPIMRQVFSRAAPRRSARPARSSTSRRARAIRTSRCSCRRPSVFRTRRP